jgi:hypothetical protein
MEVSKDLTPDMADELARLVPSMAINAPRIISTLTSAGMPSADAEDGTWNIINLIRAISTVHGSNPISEAINTLAERKRNSAYAKKPRKPPKGGCDESGKGAFAELTLDIWAANRHLTANQIWDRMVDRIGNHCADGNLCVEGEKICLYREDQAPRRISKSFQRFFQR